MSDYEYQYLRHLSDLKHNGAEKSDRTGTGTRSIFGHQMRIDVREGFPLLTTKSLHLKSIIHELLWFLNGDTNIKYLNDNGVRIWDEWANKKGDLGPVYGKQWRAWHNPYETTETIFSAKAEDDWDKPVVDDDPIDQIAEVMRLLKEDPDSRRIIVSAWNVGQIDEMALAPCHTMFQFNTAEIPFDVREDMLRSVSKEVEAEYAAHHAHVCKHGGSPDEDAFFERYHIPERYLDLQLYQRSADWFLGVPFNVVSYSLLLMMVAQQAGMEARHFIHTFGDTHLYDNHLHQAEEQLSRKWIDIKPQMSIDFADSIFDYKYEDFELTGYYPQPSIKAPVAV